MSAFTDSNMPMSSGPSTAAMTKLADAYADLTTKLATHEATKLGVTEADPHGIKAYIDSRVEAAENTAAKAKDRCDKLSDFLLGSHPDYNFRAKLADYMKNNLNNKDVVQYITDLLERVVALETELNKLSLLQFDNVPVGAGIRWWKDTLPEDGTYVWANGQTLYGVNQNFPELARAWELDSADNVTLPKEDHTIFKVRKATVEIKPIEHAYIAVANENDGD